MERRILHIDMDAFFVSVEETQDPSLKGKPVIVGGDPNSRGVVAAASYAARRYGIHSAMPLAKARRLCQHAVFLYGNHSLYAEFSDRIFALLDRYSPRMQPMSLDEAYLDLTGCERLHGPVLSVAGRIRDEIKTIIGISASIGVARNKLVAKIASDYAKPSGMLWVAAGKEQTFLAPLPVSRIPGVGRRTGEQLSRMGIKTIGRLAELPRRLLETVYGKYGSDLYRKARGLCDSPVSSGGDPRSMSRETTLERDSCEPGYLLSILSYQTEKVAAQLREEGLHARCVTLKLRYADFKTVTRRRTLPEATCCDHVIFAAAARLFTDLFTRRPRIRLIGICLSSLTPHGELQTDLFAIRSHQQWDSLYRGIDRIRGKYGFRSILKGKSWHSRV
ncbi:MAG: DNA polymerase IV [Nitrospinota bacterium]|nr:DNA polymerase IV [Nitrospinota bacterium]